MKPKLQQVEPPRKPPEQAKATRKGTFGSAWRRRRLSRDFCPSWVEDDFDEMGA